MQRAFGLKLSQQFKSRRKLGVRMAGSYSNLFDSQANAYSEFRPDYPEELYDVICNYCKFAEQPDVALDIATGSGQAAKELARVCRRVVAIDSNEEQLKQAVPMRNIEYRKGFAEDTGVPDKSIDLVTVGQALHWFDHQAFFREAHRILKPHGSFAAWGYTLTFVENNQKASDLIRDFGYGDDQLGPYWSERRRMIDEEYASIIPDKALFQDLTRTKVYGHSECTIDFFMGYLSSWSAYNTYKKRHPEREDPLIKFRRDFLAVCHAKEGTEHIKLIWPIFLMLAKPKH